MTQECMFSVMTPKVMQYLGVLCTQGVIQHRGSVDFRAVGNGNGACGLNMLHTVFSCEDLNDHVCQDLMRSEKGC